ncbi:MAG: hypothetical protein GVY05_02495 [Bacteroidetes bacterium]|jgi:hypothetical protein|nr:hypothetical protein [Bacteroidota bacterium]
MKTYFKLTGIIVLSIFCLTSCDDEPLSDDFELNNPSTPGGVDVPSESILGTWEVSDQNIDITQNLFIEFQGESVNEVQTLNMNQESGDITITFTDDGQFTSSGTATLVITGEQSGASIPETTETGVNNFASGTWSVSGGVLTLVSDQGEENYTIVSFNSPNMELFTDEELPSFSTILESGGVPDITDLLSGFEDFPDFNFDIEQDFQAELSLSKVE